MPNYPMNAGRFSASPLSLDHALAWRIPTGSGSGSPDIYANFATAVARLSKQSIGSDPLPASQLWVQSVPFAAESSAAKQQLERELGRRVNPTCDGGLRGVLLRYADANTDLVLVARAALLDQSGLYNFAEACVTGRLSVLPPIVRDPVTVDMATALERLRRTAFSPLPDWNIDGGKQGTGRLTVSLQTSADVSTWLAALGCALSRHMGKEAPVIAVLQTTALPTCGDAQLIVLDTSDASAVSMRANITEQLAGLPIPDNQTLRSALKREHGESSRISVGTVFAGPRRDALLAHTLHYRPCIGVPYPLTLVFHNGVEDTCIEALFDQTIYSIESVDGLLSSLVQASTELAFEPAKVDDIDIVAPQQRQRMIAAAASPVLRVARIDDAFDAIASQAPEALALTCDDDRLSYVELLSRANRLAQLLRRKGVKRGEFIGLCLERSTDLIVAMLAVLKAGAAYVPMDPMYPADRLAYTCTDANVRRVIATRADLPLGTALNIHTLAELHTEAAELPDRAPTVEGRSADDPAYVIYTSGSTGRPKGVVVPHRNLVALIDSTRADFGLHNGDVWSLFHSCAFDFSVWEVWGCLLTGAHLVIVPYWTTRSPALFRDLLAEHRVTVLNQTPSAFSQLMASEGERPLGRHLRLVIFGGEPLDCRALLPWLDRHPERECRLVNMYGITETTVHVTSKSIGRSEALHASRSVGPPIAGWQCYVLDPRGRLLPPGVKGEIYVGGLGVATGYHNRDDLTGERFVANPFGPGLLYRSGDIGRLLPCGSLEHHGRMDSQVKLRGFRIELDEIRNVLLAMDGVSTAAVVFRQDDPSESATARLDAYLVLGGAALSEVRDQARRLLPDFMLPASFTAIAELPLTKNGKLDIQRLPAPEVAPAISGVTTAQEQPAADTIPLEEAMLQVWQQVLRTDVTLDDNFFDLGGNSLQAIRLIAASRDRALPALDMRQLYVHQTIRRLLAATTVKLNGG